MKAKLVTREKDNMRCAFVEIKKKKSIVKMFSAVAEMETNDEDKKVYITCEWMDQNPEDVYFEVTTDSIYEFLTFERDDIEVLDELQENLIGEYFSVAEAMDSRFSEQAQILAEEVKSLLDEQGVETEADIWR